MQIVLSSGVWWAAEMKGKVPEITGVAVQREYENSTANYQEKT